MRLAAGFHLIVLALLAVVALAAGARAASLSEAMPLFGEDDFTAPFETR